MSVDCQEVGCGEGRRRKKKPYYQMNDSRVRVNQLLLGSVLERVDLDIRECEACRYGSRIRVWYDGGIVFRGNIPIRLEIHINW